MQAVNKLLPLSDLPCSRCSSGNLTSEGGGEEEEEEEGVRTLWQAVNRIIQSMKVCTCVAGRPRPTRSVGVNTHCLARRHTRAMHVALHNNICISSGSHPPAVELHRQVLIPDKAVGMQAYGTPPSPEQLWRNATSHRARETGAHLLIHGTRVLD